MSGTFHRSFSLGLAVVASLATASAHACTYSSAPNLVRSRFAVEVVWREQPVKGLTVYVSTDPNGDAESVVVSRQLTGDDGRAPFRGIKPGKYFVGVKHPAMEISIGAEVVWARFKGNVNPTLRLDWPTYAVTAQRVVGWIQAPRNTGSRVMDLANPQFQLLGGATLRLSEAVSDRTIATTKTDDNGNFAFEEVPPGLYMLHVDKMADAQFAKWVGHIPVEVSLESPSGALNLRLGELCGGTIAKNLSE